jgi:formylglycine-generating enzyme required for sulfatase activity
MAPLILALAASTVFFPGTSQPSYTGASLDAKLDYLPYTETIPGSKVRFDMVPIPGGTFAMGSAVEEEWRAMDEGPRHRVKIYPLWMGKCEVTWDEYNHFRKEPEKSKNPNAKDKDLVDAITRPSQPYPDEYRGFGKEGYPVVGISRHAAMEYCRWLSLTTGKTYRLPTEAEWEYACRAGTNTAYFFGNDSTKLGDYAWHDRNSDEQTHPVGKKKPNPWGLYDMYGNVAEWCLDRYRRDYYQTFVPGELALSPVRLPSSNRYPDIVRGGSWADAAGQCRSATRRASDKSWNRVDPARPQSIWWVWDADFVGFRVVRPVQEQQDLKGVRSLATVESD